MVRLHGPLFSEKAQKQLGHNLIYKRKGSKSFLTKYNKPGGVAPFRPSVSQHFRRSNYQALIAGWQALSTAQKKVYDDLAKSKNLKMSGWNYFYREKFNNPSEYTGLVGYWNFDKIANGKILDLSGNENHGTPKPLYPDNYPQLVGSKDGRFGKAGNFDGIDDEVEIPHSPSLATPTTNNRLSWGCWFKKIGAWLPAPNYQVFVGKTSMLAVYGDETLLTYLNIGGNWKWGSFPGIPSPDTWCFIYATWDGEKIRGYVNGVLKRTSDSYAGQALDFGVGAAGIGSRPSSAYFGGIVDEVRIYNRALSSEEIQKHYALLS